MKISKKLTLLAVLIFASTFAFAQKSPVKGFMKEMKKRDRQHVRKIGIGRVPIVVAKWFIDEEFKPLAKHIRKFRLLNVDAADVVQKSDWKKLNAEMDEAGYEQMIVVRNGGSDVSIRMKGDDKKVNFLTAFINEGDEQTIIEVKTKMTQDQFDQLIEKYSK